MTITLDSIIQTLTQIETEYPDGDIISPAHRLIVERQIIATLRGFWGHRACPN